MRNSQTIPELAERLRIIRGLLELRRAGRFNGLWTYNDGTRLGIKWNGLPDVEHLGWHQARAMVDTVVLIPQKSPIKMEPQRETRASGGKQTRRA